jgi:hypothetical protein
VTKTKTSGSKGTKTSSNGSKDYSKTKTDCPVTKEQFVESAKPVLIKIGGQTIEAEVKEFSTGSFGWYMNGKATIDVEVDGEPVTLKVQIGGNLIVVGSKPSKS